MTKYARGQKLLLFAVAALAGAGAAFAAYRYNESQMTDWQKKQKIDFAANTGATELKSRIDALSVGGITFCAVAILGVAVKKIGERK